MHGRPEVQCRKWCQESPKYGNDDEDVNTLTAQMFTFIADLIESYDSKFGHMTAGILPVSGNTPFGLEVGALPSGRRAYLPLADGVSPNVGTDTEGMGAIIKSVSHIPHGRFCKKDAIHIRVPLIWGMNDDRKNIEATADFCSRLKNCRELEFLPYHRLGIASYQYLGRPYELESLPAMTKEEACAKVDFLTGRDYPFEIRVSGKKLNKRTDFLCQ